ncbi:hypothetical protein K2173_012927 [Erythroxylum novogranatense]|uniref:Uncharacterized protein n=1 Tax=Erythroxylum novogranatense TaxID=1862640 RepID=A0AAV8S5K7_9ROSI|nr:hypothetical protein K2173_012927 [Erythroxylum novogranatense]
MIDYLEPGVESKTRSNFTTGSRTESYSGTRLRYPAIQTNAISSVHTKLVRNSLSVQAQDPTMFPQFGATADTPSKALTIVSRIGTDAHLYDDPEDVNIAPLLESKFDSEKCEALKRLLALIAQGFDVSNFFPQVPLILKLKLVLKAMGTAVD